VYAVGVAAAAAGAPRRSKARVAAMVAFAIVVVLLVMSGVYLIWPLVVTGGALLYLRLSGNGSPAR
jgi:amino acid efflux transporter